MRRQRMLLWIWAAVVVVLGGLPTGRAAAGPVFVTGAGAGGGSHVQVFDAKTGALLFGFFAYDPAFTGGVRVAAADVNGDGVPDVITAPGPGGGPHVRVFDGAALQAGQVVELVGLFAYNPAFTGGVYIGAATGTACPPSMVRSGPTCIDRYEASVWETIDPVGDDRPSGHREDPGGDGHAGRYAGGGGPAGDDVQRLRVDLPAHGERLRALCYAVSIPGVTPSRFLTWFQAAAAARNAGKRLPTNAEWQAAALGTPDGAPCNVSSGAVGLTGTAGCMSDVGAFDLVGNLDEWVADWVPLSTACPGWATVGTFSSDDIMCLAGASTTGGPGALIRGGSFFLGTSAGVFAVSPFTPSNANPAFGFCAAR